MNFKRTGQSIAVPLLTLGLLGLASSRVNKRQERLNNVSETSMEYIRENNPNKYFEILEKGVDKRTVEGSELWKQAAKEVRDSLRIDSIAKTNYAKGAQMVRDSIAKANLNDTVKTIVKSVK